MTDLITKALTWLPIKRKDGSIDPYYIEDSTRRYRISRTTTASGTIYTVWRGPTAISYGRSAVEAKEAAYQDSLIKHDRTPRDEALAALGAVREKLR